MWVNIKEELPGARFPILLRYDERGKDIEEVVRGGKRSESLGLERRPLQCSGARGSSRY